MNRGGKFVDGELVLNSRTHFKSALFRVTLEDVTMVDVESMTIAVTEGEVTGEDVMKIPFKLKVGNPVSPGRRYNLRAEVRVSAGEKLCAGDFISMEAVPWKPQSISRFWSIPLRRLER